MSLANVDFEKLKELIGDAVLKELPLVDKLREDVRELKVVKLGTRPCNTIAPVATDGGENRLSFEPLNFELIRVVDSNGSNLVETVIPLSLEEQVFSEYAQKLPQIQKLLTAMSTEAQRQLDFDQLSSLINKSESPASSEANKPSDIRGRVRAFRDIVEWAVIFDLASREWPVDVLLLRDGLLRSKIFKLSVFPYLDSAFKGIYEANTKNSRKNVYLLGVAKTSAVLSKLGLSLLLEDTFNKDYPCFAEVPKALEAKCYNFDKTWLDTYVDMEDKDKLRYQSFGTLYLVKLTASRTAPVLPVDIPWWLPSDKRQSVLEYLAYDSRSTFPHPGYPHSLQRAHDFANMTGLEVTVLGDIMIDHLLHALPKPNVEKILRHVNLGKALLKGGTKRGD